MPVNYILKYTALETSEERGEWKRMIYRNIKWDIKYVDYFQRSKYSLVQNKSFSYIIA